MLCRLNLLENYQFQWLLMHIWYSISCKTFKLNFTWRRPSFIIYNVENSPGESSLNLNKKLEFYTKCLKVGNFYLLKDNMSPSSLEALFLMLVIGFLYINWNVNYTFRIQFLTCICSYIYYMFILKYHK